MMEQRGQSYFYFLKSYTPRNTRHFYFSQQRRPVNTYSNKIRRYSKSIIFNYKSFTKVSTYLSGAIEACTLLSGSAKVSIVSQRSAFGLAFVTDEQAWPLGSQVWFSDQALIL